MKTTKTAPVLGGERKLVMMIILYLIISLCSAENAKDAKNLRPWAESSYDILLLEKQKETNKLWTWSWRKCWNEEDNEENEATDAEYNGSECEKYTVNEANEDKGGENRKEIMNFCRKLRNIINKP